MSEQIGFIGLGLLGTPMAANLLESGHELTVYNRTASKSEPLAALGAKVVHDPLEAVPSASIVVSVLWTSDATEELVTPELLARIEGGVHIGMCTGSLDGAKRLARLHHDRGSAYIEAPVFGRPEAAKARKLAIPYAGTQAAKNRVKPVLAALGGESLFDVGVQPGVPTVIKQLGNFLITAMGRSLSEGLAIAEGAGVDPSLAVSMLGDSMFPFPLFRSYGQAVAEKKPMPVSHIPAKDLSLFRKLAEEQGLPSPITQTLLQLFLPSTR